MGQTFDDYQDAKRYRWLKNNYVDVVPASRDGPEFPQLKFYWGLYTWYLDKQNPKDMLDDEIDKRMDTSS